MEEWEKEQNEYIEGLINAYVETKDYSKTIDEYFREAEKMFKDEDSVFITDVLDIVLEKTFADAFKKGYHKGCKDSICTAG